MLVLSKCKDKCNKLWKYINNLSLGNKWSQGKIIILWRWAAYIYLNWIIIVKKSKWN